MTRGAIIKGLAGLILLGAGFAWGVATVKFNAFPHDLITSALGYRNPLVLARQDYFETRTGPADVVFVGDSIFRSVEWGEEFPGMVVLNRAIDGDKTDDVLARLPSLARIDARTYVILIGSGDLGHGQSAERTARNIRRIAAGLPGRKIVLSVPPCRVAYPDCDPQRIARLNRALAQMPGVQFVSLSLDPQRDLADMMHPSAAGMRKIADAIRPVL